MPRICYYYSCFLVYLRHYLLYFTMEFQSTKSAWLTQLKKENKDKSDIQTLVEAVLQEDLKIPIYFSKEDGILPISIACYQPSKDEFANSSQNTWAFMACIEVTTDVVATNKKALSELEEGADGVMLTICNIDIYQPGAWAKLLQGIELPYCHLHLQASEDNVACLFLVAEEIKKIDKNSTLHIACYNDVFTQSLCDGSFPHSLSESMAILTDTMLFMHTIHPTIKTLTINSTLYHYSGATAVQELGISIAILVDYIRQLKGKVSVDTIANQLALQVAIGNDFFVEIGKIRAYRLLIDMVLQKYEPKDTPYTIPFFAETSLNTYTSNDKENNIIRCTIQVLAATIAGVETVSISPYDVFSSTKDSSVDANEISRNLSQVVYHESGIHKQLDVAEGTYYIDHITHELVKDAYTYFQKIEAVGGYLEAIKTGWLQDALEDSQNQKINDYISNKNTIVGVTKYQAGSISVQAIKEHIGQKEEEEKLIHRESLIKRKLVPNYLYNAVEKMIVH